MNSRIADTLSKRPSCSLITKDVHNVARRLGAMDYFVLYNHSRQKYEVHNLRNLGDTYAFTVPYDELDGRTIDYAIETSSANLIAVIDRENEKREELTQKLHANQKDDIVRDMADRISFAVDEDDLHKGYSNTHYIRKGV